MAGHASVFAAGGSDEKSRIGKLLEARQCSLLAHSSSEFAGLASVYRSRDFSGFWTQNAKPNDQAALLLSELRRSLVHGLRPEFYSVGRMETLAQSEDPSDAACFEIMLSTALILYSNDIANGRVRSEGSRAHTIVEPLVYQPELIFSQAGSRKDLQDFLGSLLTTDDRYIRLITKLAEFMKLEQLGAWPEIRNVGSEAVPAIDPEKLKKLLIYTGDLSPGELLNSANKTKGRIEAIKRFQNRHGIPASGKVDRATYGEMVMPLSRRIELILINLERRRWQHADLGSDYVYINVADQSVRFVRNGKKSGSTHHLENDDQATLPTFTANIDALRVSPEGQLILDMKADGSENDLNTSFVLKGDPNKNLVALMGEEVAAGLKLDPGKTQILSEPVNAYVTYLTVWANKNGTINFRPDRYERDRDLAELMKVSRQ